MMRRVTIAIVLLVIVLSGGHVTTAQGGMSKATMKLLVSDLLESGFQPTVVPNDNGTPDPADDTYFVIVSVDVEKAATAAQVNTFANSRSVAARVLSVRFQ